jgi:hypothetical protein
MKWNIPSRVELGSETDLFKSIRIMMPDQELKFRSRQNIPAMTAKMYFLSPDMLKLTHYF